MFRLFRLLDLFSPSTFGVRMIEAAEAYETPPSSRAARRYAAVSVCSLLAGSALLLTAALVDTLAGNRPLSEIIGAVGIACFIICVYSGLRYKDVNGRVLEEALAEEWPDGDGTNELVARPRASGDGRGEPK